MKVTLSRCVWAASAAAVVLLAPLHAAPVQTRIHQELCRLYAVWDPSMTQTSIPEPPKATYQRWEGPIAGNATANITVNYDANFPATTKAAFQAAVDIWAAQLSSPVTITINANWIPLSTGVLGSASADRIYANFGAGTADTWYHSPLANKIAGRDLDTTRVEINANFNSSFSTWYFGTDGNTPSNQYDFESVVLHEMGHGLGFSGSGSDLGSGQASVGQSGLPYIFDRFVESAAGQSVLNTAVFPSPSTALYNLFTSDGTWAAAGGGRVTTLDPNTGIYWNGANGKAALSGSRPRLDAKAPFDTGSNYSHVNEITFPRGNASSLMSRELANGESIHAPGAVTLGIFQDEGWSLGCTYTLNPTAATVPLTASTQTVTVTAPAGCAWTATAPTGSFVTITGGATGNGTGTVTYSVTASTTQRTTTLTIAGLPFVVTQASTPIITVDHATLAFGAVNVNSSGTLSNPTAAQTVAVTITNATGIAWTATSSAPWLTVTGGSGTGNGSFTVSVANSSTLAGQTSASGTITVAASGATSKTVTVTLTLVSATTSSVPTGSFDTPAEGSTVRGSIAVTGWALDNIEVTKVSIYRDAHPNDPPAAVVNGRVFVGDASFVEGARSDIETASPNSPLSYRAGWGYLMLTRGLIWDGQGPFKLYAVAFDREGNSVTLGSRTITVANASATQPFGSIDTPGQGAIISGNYANTGWVLVPGTGVTIPASGVKVFVDTTQMPGTPNVSSRSDISSLFPAFDTSQAGRGMFIDTTQFANGLHTIVWAVTASNGQADGIGSRYIKIQNSSLIATTAQLINQPSTMLPGIDNGAAVQVATGLGSKAPVKSVRPDALGRRHIQVAELQPLEVRLPSTGKYEAYRVANGQLRALPAGASFDAKRGTLGWAPIPGYVGDYEFVIVDQSRTDAKRLTRLVVTVGRTN